MSEQQVKFEVFYLDSKDNRDCIGYITLNRPQKANCFNADTIEQLIGHLENASSTDHMRMLIIQSEGKHFSAGADLEWMKASAKLDTHQNIADAQKLDQLFSTLKSLDMVTIAITRGAVYGGAVGLVACADIVLAAADSKFCLSEIKLGLLPAVILPYLLEKMDTSNLKHLALTGEVFDAEQAKQFGLVHKVCSTSNLAQTKLRQINSVLQGGPRAQKQLKALFADLQTKSNHQAQLTVAAIAKARTGDEGQAGLKSFFAKQHAPWVQSINSIEHGV